MSTVIKACFDGAAPGGTGRRGQGRARGRGDGCPPLTTLGGYLDGTMPVRDREKIEEHLVACPACRRVVVELYMLLAARPADVPPELEAALRSLVPDVGAAAMAGVAPGQEAGSIRPGPAASRAS